MDLAARQALELAFMIAWIAGGVFLCVRMRIVQRTFFLQFGYDINRPQSQPLFHFTRPYFKTFTRQANPSLEALRLKIIKRWLQMAAWIFLFPIPFVLLFSLLPPLGTAR